MSAMSISPFPVLTEELLNELKPKLAIEISSTEPLGAAGRAGGTFLLGHDSDWEPASHNLTIDGYLSFGGDIDQLFGAGGITPKLATLGVALEWISADSNWRTASSPIPIKRGDRVDKIKCSLTFPPNSIRGRGFLSLGLFLLNSGEISSDEEHLARISGFRFGHLYDDTEIVIDGGGSFFPIVTEKMGADGALWTFQSGWEDPSEDDFSAENVALCLNEDHPNFPLLKDAQGQIVGSPLFRQVLSAWVTIFMLELKADVPSHYQNIVCGKRGDALAGSVVDAAAALVNCGNLRCTCPVELSTSTQQWISKVFKNAEEEGA